MKTYVVKSIFGPTIQGEGSMTGVVVAFLRFTGCNVWDGRDATKAASACPYCDTDFVGGERLTAGEIADRLGALLPSGGWVVCSGGEPLLQLDEELAQELTGRGFKLSVETNGTRPIGVRLARHLSHVTCSPKVPASEMQLTAADDIKVLFPHPNARITPESFLSFPATRRFLQPVNGAGEINRDNMSACLVKLFELAARGEQWSLSLQLHKVIGVE